MKKIVRFTKKVFLLLFFSYVGEIDSWNYILRRTLPLICSWHPFQSLHSRFLCQKQYKAKGQVKKREENISTKQIFIKAIWAPTVGNLYGNFCILNDPVRIHSKLVKALTENLKCFKLVICLWFPKIMPLVRQRFPTFFLFVAHLFSVKLCQFFSTEVPRRTSLNLKLSL